MNVTVVFVYIMFSHLCSFCDTFWCYECNLTKTKMLGQVEEKLNYRSALGLFEAEPAFLVFSPQLISSCFQITKHKVILPESLML